MKRKSIAFLLALTIATLGITACGNNSEQATTSEPTEITTETEQVETEQELEATKAQEPSTESGSAGDEYIPTEEDMMIEDEATLAQEAEAITAEEAQASTPAFTVEPMNNTTMYAQQSVNLRVGPGTNYEKVGSLKTNDEVTVNGLANTASGSWYQLINADGTVKGYVSADYLKETKVKVTNNITNSNKNQSNNTGSTTNNSNNTTTPSQSTSNDGETVTGEGSGDRSGRDRANRAPAVDISGDGGVGGGNLQ